MSEGSLSDSRDRLLAETTWDRNVVVVAGAGTGKTTLLVNRMLNLLMREPQPLDMTEIVGLTFTNKAATEMKQRLRRELGKLAEPGDDPLKALFRTRYQLRNEVVVERASAALNRLEKAQIGTLHSFSAHLLRLHPVESKIDPSFQEDDGSHFNELFESRWDSWLAVELGRTGQRHDSWRRVLRVTSVEELRELARILAGESIDLGELERQCGTTLVEGSIREWLMAMTTRASHLLAMRANAKPLTTEQALAAAGRLFSLLLNEGLRAVEQVSLEDRECLRRTIRPTKGWEEAAFEQAKTVRSVAKQLLTVDQQHVRNVISLLRPFLETLRGAFSASGWISFDGLLVRARSLLRDHPSIRAQIKQTYRAILVDEFQDTDPIQYEIVLFLAERQEHVGKSWEDLDLEPGKLFIVGDPKQSIYAFRRADIEAFERVLRKVLDGGGMACTLRTNFRSDDSVLTVVNELFDRLFKAERHIQASHDRLTAKPQRKPELSSPGVEIRLVTAGDEEEFDSAEATRAEAESLARWIKEELLTGTELLDRGQPTSPLKPGHIALIFRKLTQAQDYLDALRRYDIAYLTDGEKHFYRRQEIIDLVNVLRVLDNSRDLIGLIGLLRSPLGGVSDVDLLTLQRIGGLDILRPAALKDWAHPQAGALRSLYERLADLHRVAPALPVPEVLTRLFDRLPLLELAAASLHGEQAVANLWKAREMAEEVADRPHVTLTGFVALMMQRLLEQPDEAESSLSEASLDAVRILTIHKAKGLEFPVVVLPGLHQGSRNPRKGPTVQYDWSSRCYGVTTGSQCDLGSVMVTNKLAAREEAEQRRLLYVGMTRARDLLVLSGGLPLTAGQDTVWSLLQEAMGETILSPDNATLDLGTGRVVRVVQPASEQSRRRPSKTSSTVPAPALGPLLERHQIRRDRWARTRLTPARLTPSALRKRERRIPGPVAKENSAAERAQLVGVCTHAVLERWEFLDGRAPQAAEIEQLCRRLCSADPTELAMIRDDVALIMRGFVASDFCRRLGHANILGREIPFVMPWEEGQIMEGMIDLMYRLDGRIWIADYKTDRIEAEEAAERARLYAEQARIYRTVAERCLGEAIAGFQFVFLRPGVTVEM